MVTSPLGGDATAYSYALVDEMWRLQFLLPPAAEWGMEEDKIMGFSVVPGIHPSDLPLLFDAGDRVRSGEVSKVRIRVHYRATVGRYGYFPADCEIARTETMPAGWLSMTYRNAAADPEGSMADRLAAITEPIVEDEPHALPTDVRTAAAVARVAERCGLTAREVEIVRLLVDGYRVTTMTKTLHLSAGTIRNYLSGVFHKVGVHGQAELIEHVRSEADPA
jgi:DNA-binding CsgD family transcriptional regulator